MISILTTYNFSRKMCILTRLTTSSSHRTVAVKCMLLLLSFVFTQHVSAESTKPDSLSRFAVNTNMLYWLSATPNAGIEWATSRRFSFALSFGYNAFNFPNMNNSYGKPANPKLHHWSVTPECRLWLRQVFKGSYWGLNILGGQFNAGGFSFPKFLRDYRYESYAVGAGLSFGHEWRIGRSWNLGVSIGAGWIYLNYDKYNCESCGKRISHRARNIAAVTKASLSIAYVFQINRRAVENSLSHSVIEDIIYNPEKPDTVTHIIDDEDKAAESIIEVNDTLRYNIYYDVNSHIPVQWQLNALIDSVRERDIISVNIDGYASPEYATEYNLLLSERRARGVASKIVKSLNIPASVITLTAHGDDWDGLAWNTETTQMKDDVSRILEGIFEPEERKHTLRSMSGYRLLLNSIYPLLRRTEVTIICR